PKPIQLALGSRLGDGEHAIAPRHMREGARRAQRERLPWKVRSGQNEARLDFLRHLVAEEYGPSARERHVGHRVAPPRNALREPPLLERVEKPSLARNPGRGAEAPFAIEPERGTR